jgi:hypothetical protein
MRLLLLFLLTQTGLAAAETYQDPNARKFYADHPEFFHFAKPTDLPPGLVWKDGAEQKEFADPRAVRGGVLRQGVITSPPTLRRGGGPPPHPPPPPP